MRRHSVCFLSLVLGWASTAAADPPIAIKVEFEAPPYCSSADAFVGGIVARTDRVHVAEPGEQALRVSVRLTQNTTTHGELTLIGTQGETDTRDVDGSTCDEVVDALALTAALALDPFARTTPVAKPPPPAPKPVKPPAPPPRRPPAPPPPPPVYTTHVGVMGAVAQIVSPGVDAGGAAFVRFDVPASGSLEPSFGVAVMHLRNDLFGGSHDAAFRWTALMLTACPVHTTGIRVAPCAMGTFGWLSGTGEGITQPASVRRTWWTLGAILAVSAPIAGHLSFELEGGAAIGLVTRRFVTTDPPRSVGETPRISPIAMLGLAYGF